MYMSITLDGVTYNSKIDKITDKEFETASKTLQENIGDLDCMHINYPMTKDHWVCKTLSHN